MTPLEKKILEAYAKFIVHDGKTSGVYPPAPFWKFKKFFNKFYAVVAIQRAHRARIARSARVARIALSAKRAADRVSFYARNPRFYIAAVDVQNTWRGYRAKMRHRDRRIAATMIQAAVRGTMLRSSLYIDDWGGKKIGVVLTEELFGDNRDLVLVMCGIVRGEREDAYWMRGEHLKAAHDSRMESDEMWDGLDDFFRCDHDLDHLHDRYVRKIQDIRTADAEKRMREIDVMIQENPGAPTKYLAKALKKRGWSLNEEGFTAWNKEHLYLPPLDVHVCGWCGFDPYGEKNANADCYEGFECACEGMDCRNWTADTFEDIHGSFPSQSPSCSTCKDYIKDETNNYIISTLKKERLISKIVNIAPSPKNPKNPKKREHAEGGKSAPKRAPKHRRLEGHFWGGL